MTKKRQGISVFAFAKEMGVTDNAVRDRIKKGGLAAAVYEDGSLDAEHARALWFATANPNRMRAKEKEKPAAARHAEDGKRQNELELRKLELEVEEKEHKIEALKASTVDREQARKAVRAFARALRDHMLRFPTRHGPAIAAELGVDPAALVGLMEENLRTALNEAFEQPNPFDRGGEHEPDGEADA